MSNLKVENVKTILTAPSGRNLVVVKVETSEPGLYGLGCATFTQRHLTVYSAIEEYLKPFLINKDPANIKDIWYTAWTSSYWRNGPVLNNALSGIDMALWDIKAKIAKMPLYELLGGKCREAAAVYRHAGGSTEKEVEKKVIEYTEEGLKYIRCQIGGYGGKKDKIKKPQNSAKGGYYDPDAYFRGVISLFDYLREKVGYEIELLHDVHERLVPIKAIQMAKELESYRLFFLEDPLPPENIEWFDSLRRHTSIPIAMGELFNNPNEWKPLIKGRLIDFIRVHISQIGGITPALKLISLCETFGIRTAWHGPGDVSPVGHAANIHLDVSSSNFGIQEWPGIDDKLREIFPGCPELQDGYIYPNEKPGLGIDINEKKAKKYPCSKEIPKYAKARKPDGTVVRP
ncbi:MAG: enolase C-terminal domain-like protein [Bacteroidota bacterium]